MTDTASEVQDLVKIFHRKNHEPIQAVNGLSFRVQRGEIYGLLGPNGAGKTTTIKILTTLLAPTSGTAQVMGYDVAAKPLAVRRQTCVVLQENAIARGSVEAVKSFGLRLLYLSLSLETVSQDVIEAIQQRGPLHLEVKNDTVEVTVRETTLALDILAAVKETGQLRHFEITSASLEDVFVQLVDKEGRTG